MQARLRESHYGSINNLDDDDLADEAKKQSVKSAPELHDEMSTFGDKRVGTRCLSSMGLWLLIAAIIRCRRQSCCHVSPPGETLAYGWLDPHGERRKAMALLNNGFCECAPIGGECGCTKWYETRCDEDGSCREDDVYACPAPLCCQTGICAHDEAAWGRAGNLTEWRNVDDTRGYQTKQDRKHARATQHPKCFATGDVSGELRKPDCNCCDGATKMWCM